jgi:hypothetical protein
MAAGQPRWCARWAYGDLLEVSRETLANIDHCGPLSSSIAQVVAECAH